MLVLQILTLLFIFYFIHQYYYSKEQVQSEEKQEGELPPNREREKTPPNTQEGFQPDVPKQEIDYGGGGDRPYDFINQPDSGLNISNNYLAERENSKLFSVKYSDYPTYETQYTDEEDDHYYRDILKGIVERSLLSDYYFSAQNIRHLKTLIAQKVKEESGLEITPQAQKSDSLVTIMRYVFLQYSKHLPGEENVKPQVAELNKNVLLEVVPKVIAKAKMDLTYQRDAGGQPMPMDRPQKTDVAGTRSNQGFSKVFF